MLRIIINKFKNVQNIAIFYLFYAAKLVNSFAGLAFSPEKRLTKTIEKTILADVPKQT